MKHESVFEYQKKHSPLETVDYIKRLKQSVTYVPLCIPLPSSEAWITFDASLFHSAWEIANCANAYETLVFRMDGFSRQLYLGTLHARAALDFDALKKKQTPDDIDISSLSSSTLKRIQVQESLFDGTFKLPKTPSQCKALYDALLLPIDRHYAYKKEKRFHYFRDTPLPYGDRKDPISASKGFSSETNLLKGFNQMFSWFEENEFDPFSLSGIAFFALETMLPFYRENLFFASSFVSLYLARFYPALASQIDSYWLRNASLLHRAFQETLNAKNAGDMSHFLMAYEAVVKDGIIASSYQLRRQLEIEKTRLEHWQGKTDTKAKIERALIRADIYTLWGVDVETILKETGVSLPSLNRFIQEEKAKGKLLISSFGKKHLLRIKE